MKNNIYIKQIFEEGLATTFYQKPKEYINKNFDENIFKKITLFCLNTLYIFFLIIIIYLVFIFNFPL